MACIDSRSETGSAGAAPAVAYPVPEWVRVRQEHFGLLFYDTRSTKLTFVRSGDSLVPPPFTGERRLLQVRAGDDCEAGTGDRPRDAAPYSEAVLSRLLADLVAKGLLLEPEAG